MTEAVLLAELGPNPAALTESEFIWFAVLIRARKDDVDEGWVRSTELAGPREVLRAMCVASVEPWRPAAASWKKVLATGECDADGAAMLSKFRSTAATRYHKALAALGLPRDMERRLVLQKADRWVGGKETVWRLPVEPPAITVR